MNHVDTEKAPSLPAESYALTMQYDPHICFLLDKDMRAFDCNLEASHFFGFHNKADTCSYITKQLMPGKQEYAESQAPSLRKRFGTAKELGCCVFETPLRVGGQEIPVEITMTKLPGDGDLTVAVYMTDITDQKEADLEMKARGELLMAVNAMAVELLASEPEKIGEIVNHSLDTLLNLLDLDKADIYRIDYDNTASPVELLYSRVSRHYKAQGQKQFFDIPDISKLNYIFDRLQRGQSVNELTRELPLEEQRYARQHGYLTVLLVPVMHEGRFWGYVGFEDCRHERYFTSTQEQALHSAALLLVSALIRGKTNESLRKARHDLIAQDYLLRGVNETAALLLGSYQYDFTRTVRQSLMVLGNAVHCDRASLWRNKAGADGTPISERYAGWILGCPIDESDLSSAIPLYEYVPEWDTGRRTPLVLGRPDMNENLRNFSILQRSNTLLIIPLDIRGEFWGFVGFSHREENHVFPPLQINLLRSASMMIASAVKREEDKQTLVRQRERTDALSVRQHSRLSHASHEIRMSLNNITGMTAMLRQNNETMPVGRYVSGIEEASQQILGAVNELLLSEPDAAMDVYHSYPLDLRVFLQGLYETARAAAELRGLHLQFDYPEAVDRHIHTDEIRLRRILDNLLDNACKFTPAGGTVTVSAKTAPDPEEAQMGILHVEVRDTGIGIAPEQQSVLFRPPGAAEPGRQAFAGLSGRGLPLCHSIVADMGGELRVTSETGKGSCFSFSLPFRWGSPIRGGELSSGDQAAEEQERYTRSWGRRRILLAEDVDINAEIVVAMLKNTGIQVETAQNGHQAAFMYQSNPEGYDLILMDVQMPVMDGIKATRQIRTSSLPGSKTIPIIAVTANALESDSENTAKAGFSRHLTKPIDIDHLFAVLDSYLETEP